MIQSQCQEAGLQFVAFEKDKYMYDLSMKRYKQETAQMNLLDKELRRIEK